MSVPTRRLEATDIPGFHLHWFVDRNIHRAIQAGYEFVDDKEVELNQHGVATSSEISGNADMGSRVRVVAGEGQDGKGEYLTLMKIKEEWFREDQAALEKRNASILEQIFRGEKIYTAEGELQEDKNLRYIDRDRTSYQPSPALFQRPTRKAR